MYKNVCLQFKGYYFIETHPSHLLDMGGSLSLESTDEVSTGPTASLLLTLSLSSWMSTSSSLSLSLMFGEPAELLVLAGRPALGVEHSRGGLPLSKLV